MGKYKYKYKIKSSKYEKYSGGGNINTKHENMKTRRWEMNTKAPQFHVSPATVDPNECPISFCPGSFDKMVLMHQRMMMGECKCISM